MSLHCDDVKAGRECVIKGVGIYMGEDPENLVREYVVCTFISASFLPFSSIPLLLKLFIDQ